MNPKNPSTELLASLGYKSHNTSIKLKRKGLGQGQAHSGSLQKRPPRERDSSEMGGYFANISIVHGPEVLDEYNFQNTYTTPVNRRKKIQKHLSETKHYKTYAEDQSRLGGRIKKETSAHRQRSKAVGEESQSWSDSAWFQVPFLRKHSKKEDSLVLKNFLGAKWKAPKKFKITSLAQLLQKTPKPAVYSKNKNNCNQTNARLGKGSKSNNLFRITSRVNKTATPKHSDLENSLAEFLKVSTISPFQLRNANEPSQPLRRTAKRRNVHQFARPGTSKAGRKPLESYGLLESENERSRGASQQKTPKNKTADYFFRSKPRAVPRGKWEKGH